MLNKFDLQRITDTLGDCVMEMNRMNEYEEEQNDELNDLTNNIYRHFEDLQRLVNNLD